MTSRNVKISALFRLLLLVGPLLASAVEAQASQGPEKVVVRREILAIVTHVAGDVSAKPPGGSRLAVRSFLAVRNDTSFELKPGATLTLVCASGAIVKFEESGFLDAELCRQAAQATQRNRITATTTRSLALQSRVALHQNSLTLWQNSPVLEGETRVREGLQGIRPVLLSPRCPNEMSAILECPRLVEAPREIRWAAVKGVADYAIALGGFDDLPVQAARCHDDPRLGKPVCSQPWPEGWRVRPGKKYFLQVTARVDLFEEATSEKTKIELLSSDEVAEIRAEVEAIHAFRLDPETRGLVLASLYAERQLFNGVVRTLEEVTRETSPLIFHLALGDAYVKVGLLHPALRRYDSVLKHIESTREHRAAAEMGLGWVHYLDDRPQPALEHFRNARDLSVERQLTHQAVRMIDKLRIIK